MTFIIGDLSTRYPQDSFQLKAKRLSNWNHFKSICVKNGSKVLLPYGLIEVYKPFDDKISILSGESLNIVGDNTQLSVFPFVPKSGDSKLFDVDYGGTLNINCDIKLAARQNKFESYKCVLKKNGNSKQIEILDPVTA